MRCWLFSPVAVFQLLKMTAHQDAAKRIDCAGGAVAVIESDRLNLRRALGEDFAQLCPQSAQLLVRHRVAADARQKLVAVTRFANSAGGDSDEFLRAISFRAQAEPADTLHRAINGCGGKLPVARNAAPDPHNFLVAGEHAKGLLLISFDNC